MPHKWSDKWWLHRLILRSLWEGRRLAEFSISRSMVPSTSLKEAIQAVWILSWLAKCCWLVSPLLRHRIGRKHSGKSWLSYLGRSRSLEDHRILLFRPLLIIWGMWPTISMQLVKRANWLRRLSTMIHSRVQEKPTWLRLEITLQPP
jgi:hypothetical protein